MRFAAFLTCFLLPGNGVFADVFADWKSTAFGTVSPSTGTAWVIPGAHALPGDPAALSRFPTIESLKQWEVDHADVAYGADFGAALNSQIAAIGYMYNQILSFDPDTTEMALKKRCLAEGKDYEDFFLHFDTDTILSVPNTTHSTDTALNRKPFITGYTASPTHAGFLIYQTAPYDKPAWENHASDGGLYLYLFEPFDAIELTLSQTASAGNLVIQYPSAVDSSGQVSQWSNLSPISDGTNDLSQSGTVTWEPPADWQIAKTHDGSGLSYGGGPYFGSTMIRDGGIMHVIRLLWQNGSGQEPRLDNAQLRRWIPEVNEGDPSAKIIPGWDPGNDTNGNGYVDDTEFANRTNTNASARFRYESRACPLGRMWSTRSTFCRSNVFNADYRTFLADHLKSTWANSGILGAYNDDMFKLLGPTEFLVQSGGTTHEMDDAIQTDAANTAYIEGFADLFADISRITESSWISSNISAENLFVSPDKIPFTQAVDTFLREDYLTASTGLTGFFGINKAWDTFAYAALGKQSIIQATYRSGYVRENLPTSNTTANWDKDTQSLLAQYYLINIPNSTYLQFWNWTYLYGSGNTESHNFHTEGVPKNVAYQPTEMLTVDIGVPLKGIPSGKEPIPYMIRTSESDYTVIGDSTSTVLSHAEIGTDGTVAVIPSYIYYFQKSGSTPGLPGIPADMVLARRYSKGLILYRTGTFTGSSTHRASSSGVMELPLPCRRVNPDGSLGPVINQIELDGYSGAVLQYASFEDWLATWQISDLAKTTDTDRDGLSNYHEFVLNTDPGDPGSGSINLGSDGAISFQHNGLAQASDIQLLESSNLINWAVSPLVLTETISESGHVDFEAIAPMHVGEKFYRISVIER